MSKTIELEKSITKEKSLQLDQKIVMLICLAALLTSIAVLIEMQMNNNQLIKNGYYPKTTTYCSDMKTKTSWVKGE